MDNDENSASGSPHQIATGLVFEELKHVQNIEPNPNDGSLKLATKPKGRISAFQLGVCDRNQQPTSRNARSTISRRSIDPNIRSLTTTFGSRHKRSESENFLKLEKLLKNLCTVGRAAKFLLGIIATAAIPSESLRRN